MANRVYNILFHTHTISGIIISAALYVIFFTGSITFLRDEISAWERNEPIKEDYFKQIDFDKALKAVKTDHELYGRDLSFSHRYFEKRVATSMTRSKDTTAKESQEGGRRGSFFYMNMDTFEKKAYAANYSLGEFFYRLHFFAQLNLVGRSGYFLAGLVAFFFLFAVLTGVIIHWKKIISSFYVFRPKAKWKAIWTDAHVALGMIGLPYQFMFAVSGAYLIVGYMLMLPPVQSFMFNDDAAKLGEAMQYEIPDDYSFDGNRLEKEVHFNQFVQKTIEKWPELQLNRLEIFNFGDQNMHIKVSGSPSFNDKLLGTGYLVFRARDAKVIREKDPYARTLYAEGATDILKRLHYGDFGGYGMKLIYFALGLITCFVILSGVLIWLVARDKKNVAEHKRKFNTWLVRVYMAICLSLYPMTALIFIVVKCFADSYGEGRKDFIFNVFFWGWLILSVLFTLKRSNHFTNKASLILGAILGFLVPVSNGIITGNWPWASWKNGYSQIFVVDVFWLLLSITALLVACKLKRPQESTNSTPPIKAKLEVLP